MFKTAYKRTTQFLDTHQALATFVVFAFFFVIFCVMYFGTPTLSSGDDHYFHFRFAQLMRERGFFNSFRDFHALYFTKITHGTYFVYYNFLFYLCILPFTYITPLYLGIKLYAVVAAAIACTVLYWSLKKFSVRYAFLWTTGFVAIVGVDSLWRLFLSRPYTLAPAILLVLIVAFYREKYIWMGVLPIVYLFWHSLTFYFPLLIAIVYFFAAHLISRKYKMRTLLWTISGTIAAVGIVYILSPGFLHYVNDVVLGVYKETILGKKVLIPEGAELYPLTFFDFVNSNIFLFSAFLIAITIQCYTFFSYRFSRQQLLSKESESSAILRLAMFLLSIGFFAGTVIMSRRFADFFIFFSWICIAFTVQDMAQYVSFAERKIRRVLLLGLGITVLYLFVNTQLQLETKIATAGNAPEEFQGVGTWIASHIPAGSIIFNPNWSWFPQLYYYSPDTDYIVGLEPRFMYVYSPEEFWLWRHISSNAYVCDVEDCSELDGVVLRAQKENSKERKEFYQKEGDMIAQVVKTVFHSSYIISSDEFSRLNDVLDNNPHFKKVYGTNKRYFVYQIN